MSEVSYRPIIEDMTWSYSRIKAYSDCPYAFFLKYISKADDTEKFYGGYGSYIHNLIDRFYKGELKQEELETEFLLGFESSVRGIRPKGNTVLKYIKSGMDYFRDFTPLELNVIGTEKRIKFKVGDLSFVGYIDLLGEKDGELYIVDHKSRDLKPRSGKTPPTAKDKELDDMLRQLYLYSLAVKKEYGKFPKALCFNCFRTGTFIEEPFENEALEKAVAWVIKSVEDIKNEEDWLPKPHWFYCKYICAVSCSCLYFEQMN